MEKIIADSTNVVIGSGTLEEYKFQVLNFMNMLWNVIENDKDYSTFGHSNLRPWCSNLTYYIKDVCIKGGKMEYYHDDSIFGKIEAIRVNLETADSSNLKKVKVLCKKIWYDLLKNLTSVFKLEYILKDGKKDI